MRGDFAPPRGRGDVNERPDECARGVASANGDTKRRVTLERAAPGHEQRNEGVITERD